MADIAHMGSTPLPRRGGGGLPYVVLVATLALTVMVTAYVWMSVNRSERVRFEAAAQDVKAKIRARIDLYSEALRAAASFCETAYPPTKASFARYVQGLEIQKHYPGIQGIGLSVRFKPEEEGILTNHMRARGVPDFRPWTKGPASATTTTATATATATATVGERHAIVFLEPPDRRNVAAIGYDMYSEPTRRAAMQRARDTGEPSATGKVKLVQEIDEDVQAGFLIYVPVYRDGRRPAGSAPGEAMLGFVYAPFRADDLLKGIFETGMAPWLDVAVYDQDAGNPDNLLHGSGTADGREPAYASVDTIDVLGRAWALRFASRPEFQPRINRALPPLIGVGGLLFSVAMFLATRAEATARTRAERTAADLRRSREALRASEAKFRRLFESNLIGVMFCDLAGRVYEANEAYFRIVGRSREDVVGGTVRWDEMTPDEYADADRRAVDQVLARGVCEPFAKELIRGDGTRVPVMVGAALLEGSTDRCVAFNVDLTALKRTEADLQRAIESAEEARQHAEAANRLKDEFLATLSHELRTPLNAILGWAQILHRDAGDPDDVRQGIETIERNARVQAQLIEDLLDVSRIVSGKLRLDVRNVDPSAVVDAAISSVELAAQAKGVALVRERAGAGPCRVWGDANRLQQVVWNLLINAIKFTPAGGTVRVWEACDGSHVQIGVGDTGKGITADFLPYVFERFRQADASVTRKHGGLGLGLSIVKHLVELHGGTIAVESEGEGRGATFRVSLPVKTAPVPYGYGGRDAAADPGEHGAGDTGSLRGVRVLVVEDDADARDLIVRMLKAHDADVTGVASAGRGLEELERDRFDVIVSDIAMPELDGYEFLARVRAMPGERGGRTPAVALTAFAREEDRRRSQAAGYQAHLSKPVEPGALCAAVAQLARAGV